MAWVDSMSVAIRRPLLAFALLLALHHGFMGSSGPVAMGADASPNNALRNCTSEYTPIISNIIDGKYSSATTCNAILNLTNCIVDAIEQNSTDADAMRLAQVLVMDVGTSNECSEALAIMWAIFDPYAKLDINATLVVPDLAYNPVTGYTMCSALDMDGNTYTLAKATGLDNSPYAGVTGKLASCSDSSNCVGIFRASPCLPQTCGIDLDGNSSLCQRGQVSSSYLVGLEADLSLGDFGKGTWLRTMDGSLQISYTQQHETLSIPFSSTFLSSLAMGLGLDPAVFSEVVSNIASLWTITRLRLTCDPGNYGPAMFEPIANPQIDGVIVSQVLTIKHGCACADAHPAFCEATPISVSNALASCHVCVPVSA
ncbi:uncharacterized protein MONBRDRAFT_29513 [Monosiga brevicollis MX1]|uniref:Pherophorin domain-containing protein n=1 Tax=Monosiga brevicollis TaxID=81824 RepID=A9VBB0_MONBE|nr:uncharacterized protein MONBRDRAFT_29513 [Monosiga brevicollis MX1]EDQ85156.1 predicted protein [Monosiga brevicollis MX1]|eukprot:XP_001749981.1 hypothetical protein [Monosiga brevicollis MX1]